MYRDMNELLHSHLPRLDGAHYCGPAVVHWVFTIADRRTGWLDDALHGHIRELMLHTVVRCELLCPVYCLMPDHVHLLWMGMSEATDQRKACTFLRRHLNLALKDRGVCLQKQAYDHVLREQDRERNAFEKIAWYILENPVRAGLVKDRAEWGYCGCVAPGFPGWKVWHDQYWPRFWCEYQAIREEKSHGLSPAATATEDR
jgi:REP element-mobilizing transposase RayT